MTPHSSSAQRGSLLIVAMILCAVIGISLVSYIQLSRTTLNLSTRSVYNNAAINIAEQGVEEAVYAINKYVADPTGYDWEAGRGAQWLNHTSTNPDGTTSINKRRRFRSSKFLLSQNAVAECRVILFGYLGSRPYIISRAVVRMGDRRTPPIEKWIRVHLAKTSKFSNGMVAKSTIRFGGNTPVVDSWNSSPRDAAGNPLPFVAYTEAGRLTNGSIGSISISADAVATGGADVWGYVATGESDPTALVGSGGFIKGSDSVYDSATWVKPTVDPNRVSTNFTATFDPVANPIATPTATYGLVKSMSLTLPWAPPPAIPPGGKYYYDVSAIELEGGSTLEIMGDVVLRVGTGGVKTAGTGTIRIHPTGKLAIYTEGPVDITGNGVVNGVDGPDGGNEVTGTELGRPIQFQLWGTSTTTQSINLGGTSDFSGVVYAPNANVTLSGNTNVFGSIVANTITTVGSTKFHYDESLGDFGGNNPFRVARWQELTRAEDRDFNLTETTWDTL